MTSGPGSSVQHFVARHAAGKSPWQERGLCARRPPEIPLREITASGRWLRLERTSGRRRGCPRRPPTPPYMRFRIRRFLSTGQTAPASLVPFDVSPGAHRAPRHRIETSGPESACAVALGRCQGLCPERTESMRDYPLMTGSALRRLGTRRLLRPLLTAESPSTHLAMRVALSGRPQARKRSGRFRTRLGAFLADPRLRDNPRI